MQAQPSNRKTRCFSVVVSLHSTGCEPDQVESGHLLPGQRTRFVLCVSFNYPLQSSIFNLCIFFLVYHHYHYIHTTCSTKQAYQSALQFLLRVSTSSYPSMELERPRPVVLEGEVSILPSPPAPFPTEQLRPALGGLEQDESSVCLHNLIVLMAGSTETYQCSTTLIRRYTRRPPFSLSHIRRTP
jgi:hypothetical protein